MALPITLLRCLGLTMARVLLIEAMPMARGLVGFFYTAFTPARALSGQLLEFPLLSLVARRLPLAGDGLNLKKVKQE